MSSISKSFDDGQLRLYWTGGAGFLMTCDSLRIGIDIYLSDACHRPGTDDFKRLTLPPCKAEDMKLDYLICTHEHGDHFDEISIPQMQKYNSKMKIICPSSVTALAEKMGLDSSRFIVLNRGMYFQEKLFSLLAVTADHGPEMADCIGVIVSIKNKNILFAGDGTYHDNYQELTLGHTGFDVLVVAINGQYGNPDAEQAASIASMLKPKVVIPCHYWLFKEHGGDPMAFVQACLSRIPPLTPKVLAVGEEYLV